MVFESPKREYIMEWVVSATGTGPELKSVRKNNCGEGYIDNFYAVASYSISGPAVYLAHNVDPRTYIFI